MITNLHPGLVLILGALVVPFLDGVIKSTYRLILPGLALWLTAALPAGDLWSLDFLDYRLVLGHVDNLSRVFCLAFSLVAWLGVLFSLNVEDDWQNVSSLVYAGSALGVTLAGDWLTLYIFWELMAVASAFIIIAARSRDAQAAALRYILVHVAGGLILLAGIMLHLAETDNLALTALKLNSGASWLIFIGVAVNAAVWPLHAWLTDAYPRATPTGAVFLSVLTTKSAVYVMARAFAGTTELIFLGAIMAVAPLIYALAEDDIRRVLAYVLVNQVGFMLVGVGLGSHLSLNGSAAHAFAHILYDGLLFMALGAVMQMTNRSTLSSLGGLWKSMPWTTVFYFLGAGSISAFPFLAGFPTKSMIISAAGEEHRLLLWLILNAASAGVFLAVGLRLPHAIFFGGEREIKAKHPPFNMILAMGLASALCLAVGIFPDQLYRLLPFDHPYHAYTAPHLLEQLQVMVFVLAGYWVMLKMKVLSLGRPGILLDTDWFYIKAAQALYRFFDYVLNGVNDLADRLVARRAAGALAGFFNDGPARLGGLMCSLSCLFVKTSREEAQQRKAGFTARIRCSALPVGLGAAAGVTGLLFLFMACRL